jgi:ferritin-like metal-binding protein YciE
MEQVANMGPNRTGIDMSPLDSKEMIKGAERYTHATGTDQQLIQMEQEYIKESTTVGSVPLPGTIKGALKSVMEKFSGHNPEMLLNKLGERLAFERSGVRIYQSLINKCQTETTVDTGNGLSMSVEELQRFCDQEAAHFQLLKECMEILGADATAQTPDADMSAVASSGLMKVITDPRSTLPQCLEAMLSIELTDNAAWELLVDLADAMGLDDMSKKFQVALQEEKDHLLRIRQWYERSIMNDALKTA